MRQFIKNYFTEIVLAFMIMTLLSVCSTKGQISKINKDIGRIKDSTYTKVELDKKLTIMGLESEKRMIQATDRTLLDVSRQNAIDEELKKLK
jgi:hypothetical protein